MIFSMTENLKGMDTFKISKKVAYIQFLPNFEHLSLFFIYLFIYFKCGNVVNPKEHFVGVQPC